VGCEVIRQKSGSDPSAVVFDALKAAQARNTEVVLVDTAGRLHTKINLMEELKKVRRIMERELPGAPHEVLLVLDATTGQNAIAQAKMFTKTAGVTGIVLSKLDGTAKGGILVAISNELKIPIRYIGIGEKIDDLREFNARDFVDALF
jgi:fused signal recognition particle receptor